MAATEMLEGFSDNEVFPPEPFKLKDMPIDRSRELFTFKPATNCTPHAVSTQTSKEVQAVRLRIIYLSEEKSLHVFRT